MSSNPTIDKLKIIAEMSQYPETKQLCNVMIEYIASSENEATDFGFNSSTSEEPKR